MRFKDPQFLFLLLLWIPMIWLYVVRERKSNVTIRFSDLSLLKKLPGSPFLKSRHVLPVLRMLGFGFLVIALARPQQGQTETEQTTEGIDIMLVVDISASMKSLDFKPENRLAVAKQRIKEFINKREHDRIGLVLFGARAYTRCPLTLDYSVLHQMVDEIDFADFSHQTAIGTALATAANRLRESSGKSKVIILLTDGANNTGDIPPMTAAEAASELGMKIHTIGVGKEGQVPFPVQMVNRFTGEKVEQVKMLESDLNEEELASIAQTSGGTFFRAKNSEALKDIYDQIDKMEKTEIKALSYTTYSEHFYLWLWIGFLLLIAEMILQKTVFRRIP
ncbi:MAG: vWA domain-containing protein [Chitinispirillaceae bacterium]